MDTQDQLMSAAQQRLDQRIAELHRLEGTVSQLLGQLDQAQEQRLTAMVDVYQRMRAKDAATVFNGLSDGVLVQVAGRMNHENLAEIMGHMQPARAQQLTQMLADQARPPADGAALLARAQNATPASGQGSPAPATQAQPAGR
jgi:flagellar motility protein MotE (MotC chaperone)